MMASRSYPKGENRWIRRSDDRGRGDHGWLSSRHTFSFANYYDPDHMGFGALRVINEDRVVGGAGFPPHPHRDMEILSYVLEGALEHRDSMGTGSVIRPGELQRMSAGTGVLHSEYNGSTTDPLHFLQVWIVPESRGINPSYEQKSFPVAQRRNQLRLLASRGGAKGSIRVHQDVALYGSLLDDGHALELAVANDRQAWLHVARGVLALADGEQLNGGDALALWGPQTLSVRGLGETEILLFDLAQNVRTE